MTCDLASDYGLSRPSQVLASVCCVVGHGYRLSLRRDRLHGEQRQGGGCYDLLGEPSTGHSPSCPPIWKLCCPHRQSCTSKAQWAKFQWAPTVAVNSSSPAASRDLVTTAGSAERACGMTTHSAGTD